MATIMLKRNRQCMHVLSTECIALNTTRNSSGVMGLRRYAARAVHRVLRSALSTIAALRGESGEMSFV